MYINPKTLFRSNSSPTTMSTHLIYIFFVVFYSPQPNRKREKFRYSFLFFIPNATASDQMLETPSLPKD
jgi:hypothetical protein